MSYEHDKLMEFFSDLQLAWDQAPVLGADSPRLASVFTSADVVGEHEGWGQFVVRAPDAFAFVSCDIAYKRARQEPFSLTMRFQWTQEGDTRRDAPAVTVHSFLWRDLPADAPGPLLEEFVRKARVFLKESAKVVRLQKWGADFDEVLAITRCS